MTSLHTSEKAITIRQPATANLLVSSVDRINYVNNSASTNAGKFLISQSSSILNGFFTRISVPEVVLDWTLPNVYDISGAFGQTGISNGGFIKNASVSIDVSGGSTYVTSVPFGIYTIATALDTLAAALTALTVVGTVSVAQSGGAVTLTASGTAFRFSTTNNPNFVTSLGFGLGGSYSKVKTIYNSAPSGSAKYPNSGATLYQLQNNTTTPSLQVWNYIDIISYNLTNNQNLKDASTSQVTRNILCRWYLCSTYQNPQPVDKYGFVIYPQYQQFSERRVFPTPKQINWQTNQPIGQIAFEVWATDFLGNSYLLNTDGFEWLMTLQVSEN